MKYWIALLLALVLNATANLMMKVGARRFSDSGLKLDQGILTAGWSLLNHWVLIVGLMCFAINVFFYAYALSGESMKISIAYPIMVGGGFTIIAMVAWQCLGESLSGIQWIGIILVLSGICLVAQGMAKNP